MYDKKGTDTAVIVRVALSGRQRRPCRRGLAEKLKEDTNVASLSGGNGLRIGEEVAQDAKGRGRIANELSSRVIPVCVVIDDALAGVVSAVWPIEYPLKSHVGLPERVKNELASRRDIGEISSDHEGLQNGVMREHVKKGLSIEDKAVRVVHD